MSERKSTSTGDVWNSGMVAFARGYSNNRHNENAYDVGRASKGSCAWRSEQFCSEARRVESSEKWFLLSSVWHSTRFHNLGQSRVAERASHKCALSPFLLLWCSKFKFWTSKTESRSQYFLTVSAGTSNTKCQISNSVHQYSAYPIYHRPAGLANFLRRLATKVCTYVRTYVDYVSLIYNNNMYP